MGFNSNLFFMKTLCTKLLFLSIFLYSISAFSQSNLQFNTVINIGGPLASNTQGPIIIVPSGKIWKVVKYSQFNGLRINGNEIIDYRRITYGGSISNLYNNGPLWLNEGDSFYFTTVGYNGTHPWFMSILEFNR